MLFIHFIGRYKKLHPHLYKPLQLSFYFFLFPFKKNIKHVKPNYYIYKNKLFFKEAHIFNILP